MSDLTLGFSLKFQDLYDHAGLLKLDKSFLEYIKETNAELHDRLIIARDKKDRARNGKSYKRKMGT
jgi:mRNA-degrading endonuclease RelE of RelBE toxin-antitoxin system